jgi:hypothetical protein
MHPAIFIFFPKVSMTLSLASVSGGDFTAFDEQPLKLSKWLVVSSLSVNQV